MESFGCRHVLLQRESSGKISAWRVLSMETFPYHLDRESDCDPLRKGDTKVVFFMLHRWQTGCC